MDLASVLPAIFSDPILLVIIGLSIGTIVINGATDAPNAIATCVATRSMTPGKAIIMAAIFNFFGVFIMTMFSTAVANTILGMVDFGGDSKAALIALMSAMVAVIVWGAAAWLFGLPTSQSHSLIAGLTGAAIAIQGGLGGINWDEWVKVIYGLFVSIGIGFALGWVITKFLGLVCRNIDFRRSQKPFGKLQDISAAILAFMHGAQDGQKFMTVCVMGVALAVGANTDSELDFPLWVMILCAASMGLGTAIGGKKIIKSVGMDMVHLEKWQGFSATIAASIAIFISTVTGLPISTTHTKTTAIMGVGSAKRLRAVKWSLAADMIWTWILTFPGCGIIAYILTFVFSALLV